MKYENEKWGIKIWVNRRYIDLWSLNHLLTGGVIAGVSVLSSIPFWTSVIILFFLLFLWEVYEILIKIKETVANRVLDIVFGLIGYATMYIVMNLELLNNIMLFLIVTILFVIMNLWGWIAYKIRSSDDFLKRFKVED